MTRAGSLLAVLALAALGRPLLAADPAGADCSGPTIEYEAGEVARGASVNVRGIGWGHECYDTGPPPPGEGILGEPIQEIEVLVTQGGSSTILARGSADDEYRFSVDVVVPAWLEPGEAQLSARWVGGTAWDATDEPIVVTEEPAAPGAEPADLVRFGPAEFEAAEGLDTLAAPEDDAGVDAAPAPADEQVDDGGTTSDPLFVLWLVLAAAGGAAVAMVVCLRRPTALTTATRPERSPR